MIREVDTHKIFVLTDDENRIVAVIEIPSTIEELKEKICLAITEDTNNKNVVIVTDFIFDDDTYSLEFEAEYHYEDDDEDDDEKSIKNWWLEKTALY